MAAALALSAAVPGDELATGRRAADHEGPTADDPRSRDASSWAAPGSTGGTIRPGPFGRYVDRDGVAGDDDRGRPGRTVAAAGVADALGAGGIPEVALRAYRRAERTLAEVDPTCGLSWSLLAAIGRVESNHGRYGGAQLREDGTGTRPIRGIPLDGRPGVATIRDTDGGRLDGDRTYDRAVGPMQFIPSTWRSVGADGNGDGRADPNDMYDAALSAGLYLCAGGADLRDPAQLRRAVLRYNHSDEYADTVLALARSYERGETGPLPEPGPAPTRPRPVTRPPTSPANPGPPPAVPQMAPPTGGGNGGRPAPGPTTTSTRPPSPPSTPAPTTSTTTGPRTPAPPPTARPGGPPPSSTPTTRPRPPTTVPPRPPTPPTTRPGGTPPGACPVPTTALPPAAQVATGPVPSGTWSLRVTGDARALCSEMHLPGGMRRRVDGTAAQLWASWWVGSADGRHVVWGVVPEDVSTVAVRLADRRVVTAPTVDVEAPGAGKAFALTLPEGAHIAALEGRRGDGTPALRAPDATGPLTPVAGYDPAVTARVPVEPVAPTPPTTAPAGPSGPTGPPGSTGPSGPTSTSGGTSTSTGSGASGG